MPIQRIKIEQQRAEIGLKQTPARMKISIPRHNIQIDNKRTELQIDTQIPTFKVNRQKTSNEMGLGSPMAVTNNFKNSGRQTALRAAGQAKNDGNFLARAGKGIQARDVVPQLAKQKANARLGPKEYNIGLMPQSPPEITWNKGHVRIDWQKHSLVIDFTGDYLPDVSVDPMYSVEVYLRKEPYVRVMVEESGAQGVYI